MFILFNIAFCFLILCVCGITFMALNGFYEYTTEAEFLKNFEDLGGLSKQILSTAFAFRRVMLPIGIVSLLFSIILFVTIMSVAGKRPDSDRLVPGAFFKCPFEIMILGCFFLVFMELGLSKMIFEELDGYVYGNLAGIVGFGAGFFLTLNCILGLSMSFASRVKQGMLVRYSITYNVLRYTWRVLMFPLRRSKKALLWFVEVVRGIPMVWRTAMMLFLLTILEYVAICLSYNDFEDLILFWLVEKFLLIPIVLFGVITMKRLRIAGEELAAGNMEHKVKTEGLYWDFKKHGENLNRISEGMALSVEQQLKSERMKTELITNVSHDIKTPLTSIINYATLIGSCETENETINEYTQVLIRQSEKLKRLIEDLVEASKAATGNLDVNPVPCDPSVFISQVAGEYDQKISEAGLELITKLPDQEITIMADSRRMWRVFDNLMNNICKYAQNGTRVYLSLECVGKEAVITFKNTSRDPLDISGEELMERFVRGDSSRNTEGNGLGLSIARSLTELQNGSFKVDVDGDLFKVVLKFGVVTE